MATKTPRLIVSGLSGDGGKTLVALGLASLFQRNGKRVAAFKKGPDYIDAAWLGSAAKSECTNLDAFLMGDGTVLKSYVSRSKDSDVAIIEGNRGLYDGADPAGTHSTAELSKLLKAPVLLVVNATKATRTLAAMVLGCQKMDPEVRFAGVILNKVAGKRHAVVSSEAIRQTCNLPVLGIIPKLKDANRIPGRHLGLMPVNEYDNLDAALDYAADVIEENLDVEKILKIMTDVEPLSNELTAEQPPRNKDVRIGVLVGGAFSFYYPENLNALIAAGAEVVPIHSEDAAELPDIDALYIGGGFPETHAERLVANEALRQSVRDHAEAGLPIYAECGGLMFLANALHYDMKEFPMCGALPHDVSMHKRPIGHGYSSLLVTQPNPFFKVGEMVLGHEFHYSTIDCDGEADTICLVRRGTGIGNKRDGLVKDNVAAFYTHVHASATPEWAEGMVFAAKAYKDAGRTNIPIRRAGTGN